MGRGPMARRLSPEELRKAGDPERFGFATTAEVAPLTRIVGQGRALEAIDFGLDMHSLGFNIYVLGESGTGKASAIRTFVSEKAKAEPVPTDWAYVFNFSESAEPIAVSLSPGRGVEFQRDMEEFVAALKVAIPKVFESKGFSVRPTISGFSIVAVDKSGEAITEEKFGALGEREKRELRERGRQVQERLDGVVPKVKGEGKGNKDA